MLEHLLAHTHARMLRNKPLACRVGGSRVVELTQHIPFIPAGGLKRKGNVTFGHWCAEHQGVLSCWPPEAKAESRQPLLLVHIQVLCVLKGNRAWI